MRKNPFPRVAHAAALGKEILRLTVRTAGFEDLLDVITEREADAEPAAVVVLGPAGSGKTHFLKLLEHTYRPATVGWSDRQRPPEDWGELQFHRVILVPNPGGTFADLVQRVIRSTLDPEALRRLVDHLTAYPAIGLCLDKAGRGEEAETNEQVASLLRKHPEKIDDYWSRFSKSEIFNAALSILEQVSRHPVFRQSMAGLLEARRERMPVDYQAVVRELTLRSTGGGESSDHEEPTQRDFEAVQIAESILALLELLEIRLLLMVDECQVILSEGARATKNALFRQLVNSTPRGSVMAFALRTKDWVRFADEASERRVSRHSLTVSRAEAWEIIRRFLVVKGGNPHLTEVDSGRLFPEEAARVLWHETGGVIGRILTRCHEIHERVVRGPDGYSVLQGVRAYRKNDLSSPTASSGPSDLMEAVRAVANETGARLGREVRSGSFGFDFEVIKEGTAETPVAIAVRQAADDMEEAENAQELGKSILGLRRVSPESRVLLVLAGYRSPQVESLLAAMVDHIRVLDADHPTGRDVLAHELEGLLQHSVNAAARIRTLSDLEQLLDELESVGRRRAAENARLRASSREWRASASLRRSRLASGTTMILLLMVLVLAGVLFVWSDGAKLAREDRYRDAMRDFLRGDTVEKAVALGEIERLVADSAELRGSACDALASYLRYRDDASSRIQEEVRGFLDRQDCPSILDGENARAPSKVTEP